MKKRIIAVCLCLALICVFLTSCTNDGVRYNSPEKKAEINYNNVSASNVSYWFDSQGAYYYNGFNIRAIMEDGIHYYEMPENSVHSVQRCGDYLYYVDYRSQVDAQTQAYLVQYDTVKEERVLELDIGGSDGMYVSELYIVDGYAYILMVKSDGYHYTNDLYYMAIKEGASATLVENGILACGVANGEVRYVDREGFTYSVYFVKKGKSFLMNNFTLETYPDEIISDYANFTPNGVILTCDGNTTTFFELNLTDGTVYQIVADCTVYEAIACERFLFYTVQEEIYDESTDTYRWPMCIYRCDLETGNSTLIAECDDYVELFVLSDNTVIAVSDMLTKSTAYSVDGELGNVFTFSGIYALFYGMDVPNGPTIS